LQSNSGRHPTPLFRYLGFHGNGSHLEFVQPVKSFHKLTAAILKLNIYEDKKGGLKKMISLMKLHEAS
jgi:hypothetical protein